MVRPLMRDDTDRMNIDHIICFQTVEIIVIGKTLPEHNQMNLRFFPFEKGIFNNVFLININ